jgi:AcrR family transcriptional regulator
MRIVKKADQRRKELMDVAYELFQAKGYAATTVDDIIRTAGTAKGTFYYYFKSKEDILTAITQKQLEEIVEFARAVSLEPSITALEKFQRLLAGIKEKNNNESGEAKDDLHQPENRELHEQINVEIVRQLSPILANVIEQGVKEGVFQVENPLETIQFILAGAQFLLDEELFQWSANELRIRTQVMAVILERALGAENGTFNYLGE